MFGRATITLGIGPHSSYVLLSRIAVQRSSVGCLSVCYDHEPSKNWWTDRNAVWDLESSGPKGEYDWTLHVQRRCGLVSNYFVHLLRLRLITL